MKYFVCFASSLWAPESSSSSKPSSTFSSLNSRPSISLSTFRSAFHYKLFWSLALFSLSSLCSYALMKTMLLAFEISFSFLMVLSSFNKMFWFLTTNESFTFPKRSLNACGTTGVPSLLITLITCCSCEAAGSTSCVRWMLFQASLVLIGCLLRSFRLLERASWLFSSGFFAFFAFERFLFSRSARLLYFDKKLFCGCGSDSSGTTFFWNSGSANGRMLTFMLSAFPQTTASS